MKKFYNKVISKIVLIIMCMFMFSGCNSKENVKIYNEKESSSSLENESVSALATTTGASEDSAVSQNEFVYVQLCGAIQAPGVYKVASTLRVFEAIEMAGGTTQEADINAVNLARPVVDEMRIYIPTKEEVADSNSDYFQEYNTETFENSNAISADDGLININEATKEKLMELPGIGESKADAIINYRNENGRFNDISEIMNISGIKAAAFEKIKDLIKV